MLNKHYLQNKCVLKSNQQGAALIAMMAILVILLTTVSIQFFNRSNLKNLKTQKTQQALALAKQALLAYAAEEITGKANGVLLTCNLNCPRPGDLPCPDRDNDGDAEVNCSANQGFRLGRLPWKTLGIDDLRDGSGERLWYAVSNNYKNNTRVLPLNSETLGTISLRSVDGNLLNDASNTTGLVAVIIAPNEVLTRTDNLQQNRELQNINDAKHFLDIAFGEDNATFVENTTDGFISGIVKQNNNIVINDIIMPITKEEMNAVIEPRVLVEVMQAILYGFCPDKVNIKSRSCSGVTSYDFFPDPALSSDSSCLSNSLISNSACNSDSGTLLGRIPVGGNANWEVKDVNSILRGQAENNWFQQNGWRELIFYARAPACNEANKNCTGSGYLTLNNAITPTNASSPYNKKVVLISAGNALSTQARTDNTNKTLTSNYLEEENISPLDSIFIRYKRDESKNDRILSIP
jgi:type II secretory pathway pseudopilin PulG